MRRQFIRTKEESFHDMDTMKVEAVSRPLGYTVEQMHSVITAPLPRIGNLARGEDTCEKLDIVLQWSGMQMYVWIIGKGYMRVKFVRQYNKYHAIFTVSDAIGQEHQYKLPWVTETHTFLGEP